MESRKGFTLVELMVVILIVGILAAVAIPIMRGRIDSAKWSEGRSMIGTVASAIRAYVAEKEEITGLAGAFTEWGNKLGFRTEDFDGTYFESSDFSITAIGLTTAGVLTFTIQGSSANLTPTWYKLDDQGEWTWGGGT